MIVGADASCDVVVDDEKMSRRHVELHVQREGGVQVRDLDSTNGVYLGSARVPSTLVPVGSSVRCGATTRYSFCGPRRRSRLLARLKHPTVAQIYDFVEEAGQLYLAMEYVEGVTFGELIRHHHAALTPTHVARLIAEVCRGLHAAHDLVDLPQRPLGVVHRDVSPQNLLLTFDGRVKILDFGIALMRDRMAPVTQIGVLKGKPAYMAPEQLRGDRVDRRADIYAAAVVLHQLLTGKRLFAEQPFASDTRQGVRPPSETIGTPPGPIDSIAMRGLADDP